MLFNFCFYCMRPRTFHLIMVGFFFIYIYIYPSISLFLLFDFYIKTWKKKKRWRHFNQFPINLELKIVETIDFPFVKYAFTNFDLPFGLCVCPSKHFPLIFSHCSNSSSSMFDVRKTNQQSIGEHLHASCLTFPDIT